MLPHSTPLHSALLHFIKNNIFNNGYINVNERISALARGVRLNVLSFLMGRFIFMCSPNGGDLFVVSMSWCTTMLLHYVRGRKNANVLEGRGMRVPHGLVAKFMVGFGIDLEKISNGFEKLKYKFTVPTPRCQPSRPQKTVVDESSYG